ncbi:MAG: dihydrofolate reductase [Candidatus Omnitrophica bacterium]|nr:dihydrofolate reductase [Candidatus Omnitrophota bacterium]
MFYHVVAMAENRVIGKDNRLPWHFSSDLKHFKQLTMGNTILIGRKTFESIGKPLPGRENFVLSRKKTGDGNVKFFGSFEDALKNVSTPNCYIIGGASLYQQSMTLVDGIYLTQIHAYYEGDTFYPEIPPHFKEKSKETLQENPKIEVIFYENTKKR